MGTFFQHFSISAYDFYNSDKSIARFFKMCPKNIDIERKMVYMIKISLIAFDIDTVSKRFGNFL